MLHRFEVEKEERNSLYQNRSVLLSFHWLVLRLFSLPLPRCYWKNPDVVGDLEKVALKLKTINNLSKITRLMGITPICKMEIILT